MGEEYAAAILSEQGLVSFWRLGGDLTDQKDGPSLDLRGGEATFVDAPAGKALALGAGEFLTLAEADHLDLPETTVELFFRLTAAPSGQYNPCLIAKRGATPPETRFSIHVQRNLAYLDVWNGHHVLTTEFPVGPVQVGEWHHLALAATSEGSDIYVDGVRCPTQQAGTLNFAATGLPLQIGASSPSGGEQCQCAAAEVAFYSRALSQDDIRRHLAAIGWADRAEELLAQRRAREEQLARERQERLSRRLSDPRLFAPGETRVYRGEHLSAIDLTLGGIGAGCVRINGEAERHAWQIFNNFSQARVPHSFFAVRARVKGSEPVARALQTSAVGPFAAMDSLTFRGEYPYGWYDFEDGELPVAVSMQAFTPLIPLREKDSAIPCAIFSLTARNKGERRVEVSFLAAQQNAVGFTGAGTIEERRHDAYGGNLNRVLRESGATILHMTMERRRDLLGYGDMALAAFADVVQATASCESLEGLLRDLAQDGGLNGEESAGPSPSGETLDGALAVPLSLRPGEARTVSFVLSWYFPNARHGRDAWGGKGNMYVNWWDSALDVARDVHTRFDELTSLTRLYHDTFYAGNLPHWLLDRITSQVAVLRSKTCFWTQDGYFGGWEGCNRDGGCCHGNCAHVWHYAQAHARLFPSIARRMRQQALHYQADDGAIPFRQPAGAVATDGQCGEVLEAYREHLCSADGSWLRRHWPWIQRAMEFAIAQWDQDEDGVLSGPQHNTLDAELGGSTTWLGSMYLAALAAAETMARLQGDAESAERYRRIRESGSKTQNETLWNGEYYIQIPDPEPQRDFLTGCDVDQMLGQWWAHQLDLGWLYPPERVQTALRSVFRYNFRADFHAFNQSPRKFVDEHDAGLLDMTWPKGGRPAPPNCILYPDEVQSGYEAAAYVAMVQAGLLKEGLTVALAAADRYDGRLRTGMSGAAWGYSGNPFGDDECGKFYARSMSIWSMLLACQGFVYDGPSATIGFKPVWKPEDHASFFTGAEGWGLFTQRREGLTQTEQIAVSYGRLHVVDMVFQMADQTEPKRVVVRVDGQQVRATFALSGDELRITLREPVVVEAGSRLKVVIARGRR